MVLLGAIAKLQVSVTSTTRFAKDMWRLSASSLASNMGSPIGGCSWCPWVSWLKSISNNHWRVGFVQVVVPRSWLKNSPRVSRSSIHAQSQQLTLEVGWEAPSTDRPSQLTCHLNHGGIHLLLQSTDVIWTPDWMGTGPGTSGFWGNRGRKTIGKMGLLHPEVNDSHFGEKIGLPPIFLGWEQSYTAQTPMRWAERLPWDWTIMFLYVPALCEYHSLKSN